MEGTKVFVSNYLSKIRYPGAKHFGFGIIIFCTFMSQLYWQHPLGIFLNASKSNIFEASEYWRLFTSTLIHGDLGHLLANSLMLFILSLVTVSFYGKVFTTVFIVSSGAIINLITLYSHTRDISLVGASGVVFCLWGFWLIMYFFIETQKTVMGRILRIGAVFLVLLVPSSYDPQTSYRAHYIGFGVGLVFGILYFLLNSKKLASFERWYIKPPEVDDGSIPWQIDDAEAFEEIPLKE